MAASLSQNAHLIEPNPHTCVAQEGNCYEHFVCCSQRGAVFSILQVSSLVALASSPPRAVASAATVSSALNQLADISFSLQESWASLTSTIPGS